ncbi:MAG: 6-phospho-3-hexuloisomerase [Methanosarcinaceae archaeon]|nr:6-phospho-3-hexuloisomerase [Methanosarcinaceae archaeon]
MNKKYNELDINCEYLLKSMKLTSNKIKNVAKSIEIEQVKKMIVSILNAKSIFVMGAGRSGLIGKAFAMRLMHLGFSVFVVGETTAPAVKKEDIVIAISGSGATHSITDMCKVVKDINADLITVTSNRDSLLGNIADTTIIIPGRDMAGTDLENCKEYDERHIRGEYAQLSPLGSSFEITTYVFLDSVVSELMQILDSSEEDLKSRHTVLE